MGNKVTLQSLLLLYTIRSASSDTAYNNMGKMDEKSATVRDLGATGKSE
ncbi:hypothetical protein [Paenibacillus sp. JNUCC31]|nr:hypothetical protein [Paenibacillus sp. JNUCC-31]